MTHHERKMKEGQESKCQKQAARGEKDTDPCIIVMLHAHGLDALVRRQSIGLKIQDPAAACLQDVL